MGQDPEERGLATGRLALVACASDEDFALARQLFREYEVSLGVDLCFQRFERELATIAEMYARPAGCLLLAYHDGALAGCGAFRALEPGIAEMKRMYVRPSFRGRGIGRALAQQLTGDARASGYKAVRLDTLASMVEAHALYESMGFHDVPPYYPNPIPGARYLELALA